MSTLTINGQEYIIEQGSDGYTYYRVASVQRFGKSVKTKSGLLLVRAANDGTPNPDIGLAALTWGHGNLGDPGL